ncbi:aldo-keto reductase family 1 member C15-like [Eumetopias jubatus]|uniref:aldo-keto reductase family 1 member C15-like n=1 Tax=Eumetopias jubatus TaxID=34886 RepID=UPI001016F02A|nr:aldo-keto reductase family 1 member C15-like [Eumetopias jubatus]
MDPVKACSIKLNDGHLMPMLGFGTSAPGEVAKSNVEEAVKTAISVGYRHIDPAYLYLNEDEIGRAIWKKNADGTVKTEDIFYTSKVWGTFFRPELVQTGLDTSLRKLGLSYVNLYLIHFPAALKPGEELFPKDKDGEIIFDTVDFGATWEAVEKCKDSGLTKSIGVSNFSCRQLEMILNKPGLKYKPVCNRVECHPYLNQSKLLEFCKPKDIVLTAYAALGSDSRKEWVNKNTPALLKDPVLKAIAEKHRCTPAQVALSFQLQWGGVVALAKSFNEKRIQENFQVFDFLVTPEDMETLDGLNKNIRCFADPRDWAIPRRGQAPHLRGAGTEVAPAGSRGRTCGVPGPGSHPRGAGVAPAGCPGHGHTRGEPASHLRGARATVTPAGSRRRTCGEPGPESRLRGASPEPLGCLGRGPVSEAGPFPSSSLDFTTPTPRTTTTPQVEPPTHRRGSGAPCRQSRECAGAPREPASEILRRRRGLGSQLGCLPAHRQSARSCFAEGSQTCTVRRQLWAARAWPS